MHLNLKELVVQVANYQFKDKPLPATPLSLVFQIVVGFLEAQTFTLYMAATLARKNLNQLVQVHTPDSTLHLTVQKSSSKCGIPAWTRVGADHFRGISACKLIGIRVLKCCRGCFLHMHKQTCQVNRRSWAGPALVLSNPQTSEQAK